jgi:SAM-dependent methyltransferase
MVDESQSLIKRTKRYLKEIKNKLLRRKNKLLRIEEDEIWARAVMQRECRKLVSELGVTNLNTLEISSEWWKDFGFKSFQSTSYPEYDLCESVLDERFDLIIAEQVFEHLVRPYHAGRNIYQMLEEGGHFLISTPFLIKIHPGHEGVDDSDYTRWTKIGMKYFLAECGFPLENIKTWSWGNRACIIANFESWVGHKGPLFQSMVNEPDFPIVVWAIAKK